MLPMLGVIPPQTKKGLTKSKPAWDHFSYWIALPLQALVRFVACFTNTMIIKLHLPMFSRPCKPRSSERAQLPVELDSG